MAALPSFRTSSGGGRWSPEGVLKAVSFWRSVRVAQSQVVVESGWSESSPDGDDASPRSRVK